MKTLILLILGLVFCGCSHSGGSSNSAQSIKGVDLTGTWKFQNIDCLNSAGTLTQGASYSGLYQDTFNISENQFTESNDDNNCQINYSGSIDAETSTSTLTATNVTVTSVTNSNCTVTNTLNNSNISPNSTTITYYTGEDIGTVKGGFIYDQQDGILGMLTNFTDSSSGDVCFEFYQKQ